jgi:hypothetical protein
MKNTNVQAYVAYRVLYRLHQQADKALACGRTIDGFAICKIIGALEYRIFEAPSFEYALEEAA